jgi:hypothetical protein
MRSTTPLARYADLGDNVFGKTQFEGELGDTRTFSLQILVSIRLRPGTGDGLVSVGGVSCRGLVCARLVLLHELLHVVEYLCRSYLLGESVLVGHNPTADEKNEMFMVIFKYFSYLHDPYL